MPTNDHPAYATHPIVAYAQSILNGLPGKTGRSFEEWLGLIRSAQLTDAKTCQQWLRQHHGLGATTASIIADRALGKGSAWADDAAYLAAAPEFVEKMYAGKEALWPIHLALIDLALKLGPDVRVSPCETIVPMYRKNVFAQIKPTTKTRLDFGLALKGVTEPLSPRLIPTGGLEKGDRITHRFALTAPEQVDAEVEHWLRLAYAPAEAGGK